MSKVRTTLTIDEDVLKWVKIRAARTGVSDSAVIEESLRRDLKLDVLDELEEIPICIGYEIDGKVTDEIPADVYGLEAIKPRYTKLKGWHESTEGATEYARLPKAARDYLAFQERESGAKIGMISTGPDRDQTVVMPEFAAALDALNS